MLGGGVGTIRGLDPGLRIAVVSDIHGNLPALQAVVRDLEQRAVHRVINLGDSLSGPLQPGETAEFLMAQPWVHLAANHERQILSERQRLASDEFARARLTPATFWSRSS